MNPLLAVDGLPDFSSIHPAHIEPAIAAQLADNRRRLQALLSGGAATFTALIEPLESMQHQLSRVWSPVGHLNAVLDSDALRAAYNACLPQITEYRTELAQNETLYRRYEAIAAREVERLNEAQRKLLDHALRDFRLAGVALDAERKARFKTVLGELAGLEAKFAENVLDCANAWSKHIAEAAELAGLPPSLMERARAAAQAQGLTGWLLTLDQPTYGAVLAHGENRALRRELYAAWNTRASDQGPGAGRWDNSALMEEILQRRHEMARILGLPNFTALSLATKMARSAEEVRCFLEDLADRCVPVARRELAALERFAGTPLEAWDVAFYAERLQQQRYAISDEELRPYFPLPRVLAGVFELTERLYAVRIRERTAVSTWHPDVRYFDVLAPVAGRGAPGTIPDDIVAGFYLDPYARSHKRSGAWMDECLVRLEFGARRVLPVAYLVCNFMPPAPDKPALLTHRDVITLFHEFGHGLHHMLTRIGYPSVSGINGVAWDAVELPSQFMENFAWDPQVLRRISGHATTAEPLPEETIARLRGTRTFHAGLAAVRQLEFALFDLRLHSEYQPDRGARVAEILQQVRARVAVIQAPPWNRTAQHFSHIFAGGYAAGYYSYKWAEVLAADAFAAFEEEGIFNPETARRFLESILSKGGSRDALDAFIDFRGRKPEIGPLLRQSGIAA